MACATGLEPHLSALLIAGAAAALLVRNRRVWPTVYGVEWATGFELHVLGVLVAVACAYLQAAAVHAFSPSLHGVPPFAPLHLASSLSVRLQAGMLRQAFLLKALQLT